MIHEEQQNLRMAKSVKTLFGVVVSPTKQIMGLDKSIWPKRHLIGIMGQLYPTYLLICTVTIESAMTSHVWLNCF